MTNNGPFNDSDLPIFNGKVYHLDLAPEELAENIIIVGDPERVPFIAEEFFETLEVDRSHRGLRTITGTVKETGQRVTLTTSGMGTPSLEIVLNEIVALNEIDFSRRTRKEEYDMLNIIRIGTSGGIQAGIDLGTLIITDYAVGLDNTGLFYDAPFADQGCKALEQRIRDSISTAVSSEARFTGEISPYVSRAHPEIVTEMARTAKKLGINYKLGITVSNAGFFANQGRDISRVPVTVPDIDSLLASVDTGFAGLNIENMEMEASFLLHFMGALNYRAGVICAVIDNRREDRFAEDYLPFIRDAVTVALKTLKSIETY
jgi:uridine phosphorylase